MLFNIDEDVGARLEGWSARPTAGIGAEINGRFFSLGGELGGLGGNHLSWWQQVAHFAPTHTCVVFAHRGRSRDAIAEQGLQLDDDGLVEFAGLIHRITFGDGISF